MVRKKHLFLSLSLILLPFFALLAHTMSARVIQPAPEITLEFLGHGGIPFAQKPFTVFGPDGQEVLRAITDEKGYAQFHAEGTGVWTLHLFSEDGHGGVFEVEVLDDGTTSVLHQNRTPAWITWIVVFGIFIVPGIFASITMRNRKSTDKAS